MGECLAVGGIENFQIYFPKADASTYSYNSAQQFAVLARIETGQRQLVPTFLLAQVAYLPNHIIGSLTTEPRLQYVSDAETLTLTSEEAPCALQPKPELHKAFLVVFDFDHFDLDIFNIETAHARQSMQASLLSFNRSLDHFDHY